MRSCLRNMQNADDLIDCGGISGKKINSNVCCWVGVSGIAEIRADVYGLVLNPTVGGG